MLIRLARRGLLYVSGAFFLLLGLAALLQPAMLAAKLNLLPMNSAGVGEIRGLYGGGFAGFGLVFLAGLHHRTAGRGLLLGMSLILGGIIVGRLASMALDHDYAAALRAGLPEVLMAACCYYESRQVHT
jgi:hypothetical protein